MLMIFKHFDIRKLVNLLAILTFITGASVKVFADTSPAEVLHVSMINLIATPEKHSGNIVDFSGYIQVIEDRAYAYFSKDTLSAGSDVNAVKLMLNSSDALSLAKHEGEHVRIVGRFISKQLKSGPSKSLIDIEYIGRLGVPYYCPECS